MQHFDNIRHNKETEKACLESKQCKLQKADILLPGAFCTEFWNQPDH